jgi:hypothetical protein
MILTSMKDCAGGAADAAAPIPIHARILSRIQAASIIADPTKTGSGFSAQLQAEPSHVSR